MSSTAEKPMSTKSPVSLQRLFFLFILAALYVFSSMSASASETFVFERMWPTLQQPWYFDSPDGIAVDSKGYVYVADTMNGRVQKFGPDGQFVARWTVGWPIDIAVDRDDRIYVTDYMETEVKIFDAGGTLQDRFGSGGSEDGQFTLPAGIDVDGEGNVWVADTALNRIQKFSPEGDFLFKFGEAGSEEGQLRYPYGVAVDRDGNVYVSEGNDDLVFGSPLAPDANHRVQKFSPTGEFLATIGGAGSGDGQFQCPRGLCLDGGGNLYVADSFNRRVQKFDADGVFVEAFEIDLFIHGIAVDAGGIFYLTDPQRNSIHKVSPAGSFLTSWGANGSEPGWFYGPEGMDVDAAGNLYVADHGNARVQKFSPDGGFLASFAIDHPTDVAVDANSVIYAAGLYGIRTYAADGTLLESWGTRFTGIAVDDRDPDNVLVYATDDETHMVYKYSSSGEPLGSWGGEGSGDGKFQMVRGIAVGPSGNVFTVEWDAPDTISHRVQKFAPDGTYITQWGGWGEGDSQFMQPNGIAIDGDGVVYVADQMGVRLFSTEGAFIGRFGANGTAPGLMGRPYGVAVDADGGVFVSDSGGNQRVQKFRKVSVADTAKAIVVAGGGPYPGNNLWDATRMCANFAYRTLTYQGFTKERIYYLSADTALDLDGNGLSDDVDGEVTAAALQDAVAAWAADADELVLYLVDHGGEGTFRLSGTETLAAADLDAWVDQFQNATGGRVVLIYDACESGSFLAEMTPPAGAERIVIGSTSPGESAYFVNRGAVSFSSYFWTHIFNGQNIKEAFDLSAASISYTTDFQHPLIDDDGSGAGNEASDGVLAQSAFIGSGTVDAGAAPAVGAVSPAQSISATSTAAIYAENVTDTDGIGRVWATVRPPDFNPDPSRLTVQALPSFDLLPVGGDRFEAAWGGFGSAGTYQVSIYAKDRIGNTSTPVVTTVTVGNPLVRKAVVVAAGAQKDELWPAIAANAANACNALSFQGYAESDIYLMADAPIAGFVVDGPVTAANLADVLSNWAVDSTRDLTLYMIGEGAQGSLSLNDGEQVTAATLDGLLDTAQETIPGIVTVVLDASLSGSFLPALTPPAETDRVCIASTAADGSAHFLAGGDLSFSRFFWTAVANGEDLYTGFVLAKNAMWYLTRGRQTALIDDNGSGIGNEKADGLVARAHTLGTGIMLAGDEPLIGGVSPEQNLAGGTSATIWAQQVTTTASIARVWAVIDPPAAGPTLPDNAVLDRPTVELTWNGSNARYEGAWGGFANFGTYEVTVFAMDDRGGISLPASTRIVQNAGPDVFEEDDSATSAEVISVDGVDAQRHNFHDSGDADWVKFFARAGETYEITTTHLEGACDTVITLIDTDGETVIGEVDDSLKYGENETLYGWSCPADGIYYVKVRQHDPSDFGTGTGYDLRVYRPYAPADLGMLIGQVTDAFGNGISGALIRAVSGDEEIVGVSAEGGVFLLVLPVGTHSVTAEIDGISQPAGEVTITELNHTSLSVSLDYAVAGDLDADGQATVADAVLALQVLAGIDTGSGLRPDFDGSDADVDGDGKVAFPDIIHLLQDVGDLR